MYIKSVSRTPSQRLLPIHRLAAGLLLGITQAHAGTCAVDFPAKSAGTSGVAALNNKDAVLGWLTNAKGTRVPTLWQDGKATSLKNTVPRCATFPGEWADVTALNDRGDIAGSFSCDALSDHRNAYWLAPAGRTAQEFTGTVPAGSTILYFTPKFIATDRAIGGTTGTFLDAGLASGSFYRLAGANDELLDASYPGAKVTGNKRGDMMHSACTDSAFTFATCINHVSLRDGEGGLAATTSVLPPTADRSLSAIAITDSRLLVGSTRQYVPLGTSPVPPFIPNDAVVYDLTNGRYTATIHSPLVPHGKGSAQAVAVSPTGKWVALQVSDAPQTGVMEKAAAASLDAAGNVLSVIDARPAAGPLPSYANAINDDGVMVAYYGSGDDARGPYVRFRNGQVLFLKDQVPGLSAIRTTFVSKTGLFAGNAVVDSVATAFTMRCSAE